MTTPPKDSLPAIGQGKSTIPAGVRLVLGYCGAIVFTALTILLRQSAESLVHGPPMLILLVIPILLSAYLGGLGPGLLATALSALGASYFILKPIHSFSISDPAQQLQWAVLLISGILISLLSESLRKSSRRAAEAQRRNTELLAEQELRKTEERYSHLLDEAEQQRSLLASIVESSEDAILSKDLEGRITSWNKGAENTFGFKASEAINQSIFLIVPSDHADEETNILNEIRTGKRIEHSETVRRHKDGRILDVSVSVSPIRNKSGQIVGASTIARDITERKRAEEDLRQALQQVDLANLLVRNMDDRIIRWSKGSQQLYGFSAEEALGRVSHELLQTEASESLDAIRRKLLVEGRWQGELRHVRSDGRPITVASQWIVYHDARGHRAAILEVNNDITEQKRIEAALANANEQLEKKVQERTTKLTDAVAELEYFSYTLTHDMRAPLRAMRGFSQILLEEAGTRLSTTDKSHLRRIIAASERMDNLIRDALNYSRIAHQQFELSSVDVKQLLHGIIDSYPGFQPPQSVIEVNGPIPPVMANEAGMVQCFANLLNNAIKFVVPGRLPHIRIHAEEEGEMVRIWVEDNGIGIAPEYHDKIFQMFQQLDKSYEGTGIGLALVRTAAQRMGGTVGVTSQLGNGSRFWLEFPKAPSNAVQESLIEQSPALHEPLLVAQSQGGT